MCCLFAKRFRKKRKVVRPTEETGPVVAQTQQQSQPRRQQRGKAISCLTSTFKKCAHKLTFLDSHSVPTYLALYVRTFVVRYGASRASSLAEWHAFSVLYRVYGTFV